MTARGNANASAAYRFASCDDKSPHLLLQHLSGHVVHGANDTLHMDDSLVKVCNLSLEICRRIYSLCD